MISSFSAQDANLQPSAKAVRGNVAPAQSGFSSHARASRKGCCLRLAGFAGRLLVLGPGIHGATAKHSKSCDSSRTSTSNVLFASAALV